MEEYFSEHPEALYQSPSSQDEISEVATSLETPTTEGGSVLDDDNITLATQGSAVSSRKKRWKLRTVQLNSETKIYTCQPEDVGMFEPRNNNDN
ncbi:hypothetical protein ACA910_020039 [Epithemia clementina (nom. ined.)]